MKTIRSIATMSVCSVVAYGVMVLLAITSAPARPFTPVFDVHVHTAPERYPLVADILGALGVTRFVNLSGGTVRRGLFASIDAAHDMKGRILVCVNIDWARIGDPTFIADTLTDLKKAKEMGAACIKISKALGLHIPDPRKTDSLLAIDDPMLDPIWRLAGQLKLPIFIHTGDPKAFFEPPGEHNERHAELSLHPGWSFADRRYPRRHTLLNARDRVLSRHENTVFIGVHFANNPEDLAYVRQALTTHPNLYVDLAARLPELGRHPPNSVRQLFIDFQDKILFGTDLGVTKSGIMLGSVGHERPDLNDIFVFFARHFEWLETNKKQIEHPTPIQGDWRIDAIELPEQVLRKIYYSNAMRLLWKQPIHDLEIDARSIREGPHLADFLE